MSYYSEHDAGEIVVKGVKYQVLVTQPAGKWVTYIDGNLVEADSLEGLKTAVAKATRKAAAKVSVPFVKLDRRYRGGYGDSEWYVRHGTATGIHSSNRSVLVRWDDTSKAEQLDRWGGSSGSLLAEMSKADEDLWLRLEYEARQAAEVLAKFRADHKIDLPKAVETAVEAAVTGGDDES